MSAKSASGLRKRTLHQIGTDSNEQPQSKKPKFDASMPIQPGDAQFDRQNEHNHETVTSVSNHYDNREDTKLSDDDSSDSSDSSHAEVAPEHDKQKKSQASAARQHSGGYVPVSDRRKLSYASPQSIGMKVRPNHADHRVDYNEGSYDQSRKQPYLSAPHVPRRQYHNGEWRVPFCCSFSYMRPSPFAWLLYAQACPWCAHFDNALSIGFLAPGTDRCCFFIKWVAMFYMVAVMLVLIWILFNVSEWQNVEYIELFYNLYFVLPDLVSESFGWIPSMYGLTTWMVSVYVRREIRKYYQIDEGWSSCLVAALANACCCQAFPISQEIAQCHEELLL